MWVTVCLYVTCITDNYYCDHHLYTTLYPVHLNYYYSTLSVPHVNKFNWGLYKAIFIKFEMLLSFKLPVKRVLISFI